MSDLIFAGARAVRLPAPALQQPSPNHSSTVRPGLGIGFLRVGEYPFRHLPRLFGRERDPSAMRSVYTAGFASHFHDVLAHSALADIDGVPATFLDVLPIQGRVSCGHGCRCVCLRLA